MDQIIPEEIKTVLGFDFGLSRIGVAVGQTITYTAQPLTIIQARQGIPDWKLIEKLIHQWQPQVLLVGWPLRLNNDVQSTTKRAQKFGQRLHGRFGLPVVWVDERLTSYEAQDMLNSREGNKKITQGVDALAAALIVETWLSTVQKQS